MTGDARALSAGERTTHGRSGAVRAPDHAPGGAPAAVHAASLRSRHVWVDGRLHPADGVHLSAYDRGFQLGDGVFEALRVRGGRIVELEDHAARLRNSATGLEIRLPDGLTARLEAAIRDLLSADGLDGPDADASVRITASRGAQPSRAYLPDGDVAATIVVQAWPVPPVPADVVARGLSVILSSVRHDPDDPLVTLKTTSRAGHVYARIEARRAGADDAIFPTTTGHLAEATSSNLFIVRGDELATPAPACGILPGTTRSWVLDWAARVGLRVVEAWLTPEDLAACDEAFLCASIRGIMPVTRFAGLPVGSGRPGPWTMRARAAREAFVRGHG